MSPRSLGRVALGLLLALGVAFGTVAPASADDASLKQAIKRLDKRAEKQVAKIPFPDDETSPTFGADYAAAVAKFDKVIAAYRKGVAAERASTSRGRRARTLMLRAVGTLRTSLTTVAGVVSTAKPDQEPTAEQTAKLKTALKQLKRAAKDNSKAYRLLGLKEPKPITPSEPGTTTV